MLYEVGYGDEAFEIRETDSIRIERRYTFTYMLALSRYSTSIAKMACNVREAKRAVSGSNRATWTVCSGVARM